MDSWKHLPCTACNLRAIKLENKSQIAAAAGAEDWDTGAEQWHQAHDNFCTNVGLNLLLTFPRGTIQGVGNQGRAAPVREGAGAQV